MRVKKSSLAVNEPSTTVEPLTTVKAPTVIVPDAPIVPRLPDVPRYHGVAKCRWCGGRFVQIYQRHWICETAGCAERQERHAILKPESTRGSGSPYLFLPLPLQVDIQTDTTPNLLVAGAAGTSKSFGSRWGLYAECRAFPGLRCLLLRCTYDQLLKNHLQFMDAECRALGDAKYTGGNVRQISFENGSMIFSGYCDDDSDIEQHLGPEWDRIVFEEGVTFLPRALNEIAPRARGSAPARDAGAEGLGFRSRSTVNSNPGGRAMLYLYHHYIDKRPDPEDYPTYDPTQFGFISSTLDDNPYLKEDYARANLSGLSAARFRQLRYGDWSVFAGQFFAEFDPSTHVLAEGSAYI